jgi:DNA-binding MarR family transcriptional regulator
MLEAILIGVLSAFTLAFAFLYRKRISETQREYSQARTIIEDIVVSFNRQLKASEDRFEASARKINALSSSDDLLAQRVEKWERKVRAIAESQESSSEWEPLVTRVNALETKLGSTKNALLQKISELGKQRQERKAPAVSIESAIPIKREDALAPLTVTELRVLELLAAEGGKTSPEIKERIKLSREHSARLMKKLYEAGYLERSASRIPFTYSLKEEMLNILRRPEQKS